MKNKIYYSPEAVHDLDEIRDYVMMELCNPDAALNVVSGIIDIIDKLKDFAEMGAPLSSIADVESDYRFLIYGNYIAFYRYEGINIYIDRILYGRRDYLRILFDDMQSDTE